MTGQNLCAMCDKPTPADRGLLCPKHRAEDQALIDDVQPSDPSRAPDGEDGGND